MAVTPQHIKLAQHIDQWVKQVESKGGGDEQLLEGMFDFMGTFKTLLDTTTSAQMDALCLQYAGFYRFAKLLERIAQGHS